MFSGEEVVQLIFKLREAASKCELVRARHYSIQPGLLLAKQLHCAIKRLSVILDSSLLFLKE